MKKKCKNNQDRSVMISSMVHFSMDAIHNAVSFL